MRATRDLAAPAALSRRARSPEAPGVCGASTAPRQSHRRVFDNGGRLERHSGIDRRRIRGVDGYRCAQIGLQRVIADPERATCFALVAATALEHDTRVAAGPGAQ